MFTKLFSKRPVFALEYCSQDEGKSEAAILFDDFKDHLQHRFSTAQAQLILSAAVNQTPMAHEMVTTMLGDIARRRKGRIDSDKTRLAANGKIADLTWPNKVVQQSVGIYASDNGTKLGFSSVTLTELKGVGKAKGKPGELYLITRPTALIHAGGSTAYPATADMHVFTAHAIDRLVERLWGKYSKNRTEALLALRHLFVSPRIHPAVLLGNFKTHEMVEVFRVGQDQLILVGSMHPLIYPATNNIMPFFFVKTALAESMLDTRHRQELARLNVLSGPDSGNPDVPEGWWRRDFVD